MQIKSSRPSAADPAHNRREEKMKTITMEVPEDVLIACMRVVQWVRGSETEGEVGSGDVIENSPVLEEWLMELGVLPESIWSDGCCTNSTAGSTSHLFEKGN
jgi:hypothetical protein